MIKCTEVCRVRNFMKTNFGLVFTNQADRERECDDKHNKNEHEPTNVSDDCEHHAYQRRNLFD